jgi:hypothetical protein
LPVLTPAIKVDSPPVSDARQILERPKEGPRSAAPSSVASERKKTEQTPGTARKPKREEGNDGKHVPDNAKLRAPQVPKRPELPPAPDHAQERTAAERHHEEKKPQVDQPHP